MDRQLRDRLPRKPTRMRLHGRAATGVTGAAALAAVMCALACIAPAAAQPAGAPGSFEQLFEDLARAQAEGAATLREIAEAQRRAAAALEAAVGTGTVKDPRALQLAPALVANARTLAAIALAPAATVGPEPAASLGRLLQTNLQLLHTLEQASPQGLEAPLAAYAARQRRAQELAGALQHGWEVYAGRLTAAQISGAMPAGSFGPSDRSWALQAPSTPATASFGDLVFEAGSDAAGIYAEVGIAPAEPGAGPDAVAPAATGEAAPQPLPAGDAEGPAWVVEPDARGLPAAVAANTDPLTSARIRSLMIDCHTDGTLRYTIGAEDDFTEYRVYASAADFAVVRASANVITGGQALLMSDVLRMAFEWAGRDASLATPMVISPSDAPDLRVALPVRNYLEARGAVLDGCAPWPEPPSSGAAATAPDREAAPAGARAPTPYPRPANRP